MPKITNPSNGAARQHRIRSPRELGNLLRAERKRRGLTLSDVYDATGLSTRFLSELERGKENASLGRTLRALSSLGLDVVILPRAEAERILHRLSVPPTPTDGDE